MFKFDEQFFKKHQKGLLYIANRRYLRWLLGLNRLPIELIKLSIHKITPNSIHSVIGKFTKKGTPKHRVNGYFFSRPRFAEALAYNLSPFCYFANFRQNKMVWRFSLVGLIGCLIFLLLPIKGFCFIGTTTDYLPSTGGGMYKMGTAGDTFANARNATAGTDWSDWSDRSAIACSGKEQGGINYYIYYWPATFNTSDVGSGSTVDSATLKIYCTARDSQASYSAAVYNSSHSDTIILHDFDTRGSTLWSDVIAFSSFSVSNWNTFTLTSTGKGAINKTGNTKLCIRESAHDADNVDPNNTNAYFVIFRDQRYTGTSYDPYLTITYSGSAPANTTNFFQLL